MTTPEIRTINQVKIWILNMNPMTGRAEGITIAALAYHRESLVQFYNEEKVESYRDGQWGKSFKAGGRLEWFNPLYSLDDIDTFGCGIRFEWVDESIVTELQRRHNFIY
jgi:hypothetical protein